MVQWTNILCMLDFSISFIMTAEVILLVAVGCRLSVIDLILPSPCLGFLLQCLQSILHFELDLSLLHSATLCPLDMYSPSLSPPLPPFVCVCVRVLVYNLYQMWVMSLLKLGNLVELFIFCKEETLIAKLKLLY